jgi:hypothetical protein
VSVIDVDTRRIVENVAELYDPNDWCHYTLPHDPTKAFCGADISAHPWCDCEECSRICPTCEEFAPSAPEWPWK